MAAKSSKQKANTTVAKTADGTVQITFTVPAEEIAAAKQAALVKLGQDAQVPGFRKGKAPAKLAASHIPEEKLVQTALGAILPGLVGAAITEHKLRPAIYPRFELISAKEGEDWQIRAITCELPEVDLGDYKKAIAGAGRAKAIWTPTKGSPKAAPKEPDAAEKEQQIIKILLETIKVDVPALLIEEEVNSRLSNLLGRIEKLGLSLEGYLTSVGKTPESLRAEYNQQARAALALDLILGKIAEAEKIEISDQQVEKALKDIPGIESATEEQKREQTGLIRSVLRRRASLDSLVSLL